MPIHSTSKLFSIGRLWQSQAVLSRPVRVFKFFFALPRPPDVSYYQEKHDEEDIIYGHI